MGKSKISIQKIKDERLKKITFYKRRKGLLKKAMELSLLCEADILVGIYPKTIPNHQLLLFCSTKNVDLFLDQYIKNPQINRTIYSIKDVNKI
jgi:MADS-box transcription factor